MRYCKLHNAIRRLSRRQKRRGATILADGYSIAVSRPGIAFILLISQQQQAEIHQRKRWRLMRKTTIPQSLRHCKPHTARPTFETPLSHPLPLTTIHGNNSRVYKTSILQSCFCIWVRGFLVCLLTLPCSQGAHASMLALFTPDLGTSAFHALEAPCAEPRVNPFGRDISNAH